MSVLDLEPDAVVRWNAARRAEYTIEVVSRLRELWVLEGSADWAVSASAALQVWSGQWFAARCAVGDRSAMQPGFVEPGDWDGLAEDYDEVELFPTPEDNGLVLPTSDFLDQLQGGPLTKLLTPDHSERVWGEPLRPDHFRLRTTPWYTPWLTFGDEVEARDDGADLPVIVRRTAAGGRHAERFLFACTLGSAARATLLAELSEAGAEPVNGDGDLVVVDVGDEDVACEVQAILARAAAEGAVERGSEGGPGDFVDSCRRGGRSDGRVVGHPGRVDEVVLADIRGHELAEQDWEALPAEREGDDWRITGSAFYAYDVAPGDVVAASVRPGHLPVLQSVLRRGEHGVLRVVPRTDSGRDAVVALARRLVLPIEYADHANLIALDLPSADVAPEAMQALDDLQAAGELAYETGWT